MADNHSPLSDMSDVDDTMNGDEDFLDEDEDMDVDVPGSTDGQKPKKKPNDDSSKGTIIIDIHCLIHGMATFEWRCLFNCFGISLLLWSDLGLTYEQELSVRWNGIGVCTSMYCVICFVLKDDSNLRVKLWLYYNNMLCDFQPWYHHLVQK